VVRELQLATFGLPEVLSGCVLLRDCLLLLLLLLETLVAAGLQRRSVFGGRKQVGAGQLLGGLGVQAAALTQGGRQPARRLDSLRLLQLLGSARVQMGGGSLFGAPRVLQPFSAELDWGKCHGRACARHILHEQTGPLD